MRRDPGFWAWFAGLYGGGLALLAVVGAAVTAGLEPAQQQLLRAVLDARAPLLASVAALLGALCWMVAEWVYRRNVRAVRGLAEQVRVLLGANPAHRLGAEGNAAVTELAAEINRLADSYGRLRTDLDARVAEARARVEEDRNRLAALMSELSQGVVVCNADGRVLLYNERAHAMLSAAAAKDAARSGVLGLGRSVFGLLDRDEVLHALDKVQQGLERGTPEPGAKFVTTLPGGALARVQVAPFRSSDGRLAGMVFALDDVTGLMQREAQRRTLLQRLASEARAPLANLRAAGENLASFPDMDAAQRARFTAIVAEESGRLSLTIELAMREYADALKASLTLEDMQAEDLVAVARRRIEALGIACVPEEIGRELWLRVDSFSLVQAMAYLAATLAEEYSIRTITLRASVQGGFVALDMAWRGAIVSSHALALWETQPMQAGTERTPLTLRDVLERHGGELWCERHTASQTAWFRFLLPRGEPITVAARRRAAPAADRPEYYDFDLFDRGGVSHELEQRKLTEISYTVFDTETTGLEPSAGDEIISIGAVRIVNGRLLKQETFDQLVDPRRPLGREGMRIHGIDAQTLAGQPTIEQVLPAFHRFAEDAVLVAHNGAFDMRFLELKEESTGVRFTQPILDTLLLSAVVHPNQDDHRLEAIAERLGVPVIGRHTALGDALVTGEVFVRLLPLLAERGIRTLGDALAASRETYYARLHY
jgi:DNA polymerase-3 subunit epsilon